jgi:hypothetical protein
MDFMFKKLLTLVLVTIAILGLSGCDILYSGGGIYNARYGTIYSTATSIEIEFSRYYLDETIPTTFTYAHDTITHFYNDNELRVELVISINDISDIKTTLYSQEWTKEEFFVEDYGCDLDHFSFCDNEIILDLDYSNLDFTKGYIEIDLIIYESDDTLEEDNIISTPTTVYFIIDDDIITFYEHFDEFHAEEKD